MVPNLKVTIVLDYARSSRDERINSFSLLNPLVAQFGSERFRILCYKNPFTEYFGTKFKIKHRLNEIFGVHHMKYLVFDNNVLLTG